MKQTDQPTKSLPPQGRLGSYHRACELASRLVLHSTSSGHRGDDLGNVAADFHLTDRLSGDGQQVVTEADGFPTGFLRPSPTSPNHGRSQPGWKATVSIDQQYRNGDERGFRGQIDQENEAHRGKRGRSKQREFRDEEDFPLGNGRGACGAVCNQLTADQPSGNQVRLPYWPLFGLVSQHFGTRRGGTGDFLAGGNIGGRPTPQVPVALVTEGKFQTAVNAGEGLETLRVEGDYHSVSHTLNSPSLSSQV
ncbi:hypothetical protein ASPNIDRAFT_45195 [Aspergillus niger ATCC 1015]|uniref:Uncharacterized protein n=1 Tax=Aspergillus niger (strain ATCC 1015 / CBS 113.46 / FGSC A1144 / LSHB Ac4 / NCTC 3858a / NRRL 328 / USDA 3528.7) TaxID=380704 RepID=G3Y4Q2_ASPNA|nr:hypothetical protein ASPNIDRAFT_45195 [Aspergillus niger ATCC 1015]